MACNKALVRSKVLELEHSKVLVQVLACSKLLELVVGSTEPVQVPAHSKVLEPELVLGSKQQVLELVHNKVLELVLGSKQRVQVHSKMLQLYDGKKTVFYGLVPVLVHSKDRLQVHSSLTSYACI